ncbi:MAG: acyltransferase [Oscillospiraceae bacterium]|nr:acyltransferase [Oscillospiraceae bacterium]
MSYKVLSKYRSELMGVAMLWVMCFHAFDLDLGSETLNNLRADGFGGVDIFILLSSMGLAMSLSRKEVDFERFMRRRALRILPAYFAVMLPYTLYTVRADGVPWIALLWNSTLLYYWVHCRGAFNWYVAGAMTFYALTPCSFRALRGAKRRELLTAGAAAAGVLVCQWLMHADYWQYLDVFYRFPIFFVGLLIGFYVPEDRKLTGRGAAFWGLSFALGVAYGALVRSGVDTSPVWVQFCHVFLFTTVPVCLALCLLFEKLPLGAVRRCLRLVGENSLEIYLLNVSFFSRVLTIRRYVSIGGPTHRLYYLVMFAANIALGCLLHRAIEAVREKIQRKPKELPNP